MNIVLLGAGNVATHLCRALHEAGHKVMAVYSRTLANAQDVAQSVGAVPTTEVCDLPEADAYLFSVKMTPCPHSSVKWRRCILKPCAFILLVVYRSPSLRDV